MGSLRKIGISWDQISGQLRGLLMFLGGYAVARGWVDEVLMVKIVGIVMLIGGSLWSAQQNTETALIASVDAIPSVAGVVTKHSPEGHELAMSVPSPTVVRAGTEAAASMAANQTPKKE